MGYEYRITCSDLTRVPDFDEFIRRQPWFESYDEERKIYNLRTALPQGEERGPDCIAVLEAEGIYFCDYLSDKDGAAKIIRSFIDEALKHSDSVTIGEP